MTCVITVLDGTIVVALVADLLHLEFQENETMNEINLQRPVAYENCIFDDFLCVMKMTYRK